MGSKFWSEHFFAKKLMFFGDGAPKKWPKTKVVRFWWNLVPRGFRGCWFQKSHPFSRVIIIWRSIVGFLGAPSPPPKIVEIESLSDFDEIWWMLVFDDANFKHRIHFSVVIVWEYILSLCVSYKCAVGGATQLPIIIQTITIQYGITQVVGKPPELSSVKIQKQILEYIKK